MTDDPAPPDPAPRDPDPADSAEARAMQAALATSRERLERAMEATRDGLYDWDLRTNQIYYSPSWKSMLGYEDEELPNDFSVWERLTDADDVARAWEMQQELVSGQRDRFELEFKMRHRDGHWVDVLSRAIAVYDAEGAAVRIVGTHVDITERKQQEAALREARNSLDSVVDHSPFAMWISDSSGTVIRTNDALRRLLQLTDAQIVGQYNVLRDANLTRQGVMPAVRAVFEEQEPARFAIPWEAGAAGHSSFSGGRDLYIDASLFPILGDDGELRQVVCQWADVTAHKQAEQQLRQSEERFQLAERAADMGVWERDLATDEVTWSDNVVRLFGMDTDAFSGTFDAFLAAMHPDDRVPTERETARAVAVGGWFTTEYRVGWPDGTTRWLCDEGQVFDATEESPGRLVGTVRDITERKRGERRLSMITGAVENSLHGFEIVGEDGLFVYVNQAYVEMWGYDSAEEIVGTSPAAHWADPEVAQRIISELQQSGAYRGEFEARRKDGSRFWVLMQAHLDHDHLGRELYHGSSTDLTERRSREREIERLNETLEAAQRMARMGYWRYDIASQMPTWSDQMFEVCGCRKEDGVPSYEEHKLTWHPDDWEAFDEAVQGCTRGTPYNIVVRIRFPDGSYHHVNTQGFPIRGEDGEIRELFGTSQDITELRLAEEKVIASEWRFRTLYENAPFGILVCELLVDEEGKPVDFVHLEANGATAEHTGFDLEQIAGRRASQMVGPEELCKLLEVYDGVVQSREPAHYTQAFELYDKTLDVTAFPLQDRTFIIIFIDVSARVRAEQAVAQHRDQLEKEVRSRTRELRSMVNAMGGREVRMAELKRENEALRQRLRELEAGQ